MNRLISKSFKETVTATPVLLEGYAHNYLENGFTEEETTIYLNDTETAATSTLYDKTGRAVLQTGPDAQTTETIFNERPSDNQHI